MISPTAISCAVCVYGSGATIFGSGVLVVSEAIVDVELASRLVSESASSVVFPDARWQPTPMNKQMNNVNKVIDLDMIRCVCE